MSGRCIGYKAWTLVLANTMIELEIEGDTLLVQLRGWDKIWALKSELRVPLRDITSVRSDAKLARFPRGLRCPGTYLPGVITAGSYWRRSGWAFWSVRKAKNSIVIETARGKYRRIIIESENYVKMSHQRLIT